MKKNLLPSILGGFIGFAVGVLGGGYLGLILGGTFLGGFDIYENIGIEGYELSTYVGAIVGALVLTLAGVKLALKIADRKRKTI
ncbi:MAG: hypothetical protein GX850_06555 [Clostridiaceae bacterium]|nr:hypothetical protein [Clostridiaceae bacterium]